jgi:hypothetical protein
MSEGKPDLSALRELLNTGPLWLRLVVAAVLIVVGYFVKQARTPEPPPAPLPVTVTVTPTVTKAVETQLRPQIGYRLFAAINRNKVERELRANGFALVGGPAVVTESDVKRLVAHLDDDTVHAASVETGALGDGAILQFIRAVLRWPIDHPEEFARLLKFLLTILLTLL